MDSVLEFEEKVPVVFSLIDHRIARCLVWHTGAILPGHNAPYNRNPIDVQSVIVNNTYLSRMTSYAELKAWNTGNIGAFFQDGQWLYVRVKERFVPSSQANSFSWYFTSSLLANRVGITSGLFQVINGVKLKTGLLSRFKIKLSADNRDYSQIKFENQSFELAKGVLGDDIIHHLIGTNVHIKINDVVFDKLYIENIIKKLDSYTIKMKDSRAMLKNSVVNQKFTPNYGGQLTSGNTNNHTSADVQKKDIADAIGYCYGVPGVCVNDYAYDSDSYRYYRFCYNQFTIQEVEVQVENGWKKTTNYSAVNITETLPSGLEVQTKLLKVPVGLVTPPVAGTPAPDYNTQPRALRVTGTFHSEIANSHLVKNIIQYLIERYTVLPYNSEYFNIDEITSELDAIPDVIGIYIDKPTDVYKVIARLQTGCRMGFKFCSYGGKYTARVHNPNRAARFNIRQYDIKNLYALELDMNGDDYISDGYVRYAKNYSEDTWNEYRDEYTHTRIVAERGADIAGGAETLMAREASAIMRYNNFMRDSIALSYTISGAQLNEKRFSEFRRLREYDICDIDFGILTNIRRWYVMKIEIDFFMESVTIDVRSV